VRKRRVDYGKIRLNDRDVKTLGWLAEQYAIRLDSLQLLLGRAAYQATHVQGQVQTSTARRVVQRWRASGLVGCRKLFFGQPSWLWLTRRGLSEFDLAFQRWTPKVGQLQHLHEVNCVRLSIEAQYLTSVRWRCERMLRRQYRERKEWHLPDGEVRTLSGATIGVEVELTPKSRPRVAKIVHRLAHQYDQIWFFVNPRTRPVITAATQPFGDLFQLYDIDQVRLPA
jgi:hypothetical protein